MSPLFLWRFSMEQLCHYNNNFAKQFSFELLTPSHTTILHLLLIQNLR